MRSIHCQICDITPTLVLRYSNDIISIISSISSISIVNLIAVCQTDDAIKLILYCWYGIMHCINIM